MPVASRLKGAGVRVTMGRDFDRAKTAAISQYVKNFRDDLLRELPEEARADRNTKRQELIRLGRARFNQEPQSVQRKYFRPADLAGKPLSSAASGKPPSPASSAEVKAPSGASSPTSAAYELVLVGLPAASTSEQRASTPPLAASTPKKRPLSEITPSTSAGAQALVTPGLAAQEVQASGCAGVAVGELDVAVAKPIHQHRLPSGSAGVGELDIAVAKPIHQHRLHFHEHVPTKVATAVPRGIGMGMPNQGEVMTKLGNSLGKLQDMFGVADGAAVLAAGYRIAPHASGIRATVEVKSAAILSLAVKMELSVENASIRKLWRQVAGNGMLGVVKATEMSIFERLALSGVTGPYAEERMAKFSDE